MFDKKSLSHGMVVGTRNGGLVLVIIWTTGHVEWRVQDDVEKFIELFKDKETEGRGGVSLLLSNMVDVWIHEHNSIVLGINSENDFSDGFAFVREPKRRRTFV